MKHEEHICHFNDGEQSCDCFDAGYKKGSECTFCDYGETAKKEIRARAKFEERKKIKLDLIKIADAGEYEDLRREVELYFK